MDPGEVDDDLVRDVTEILTSLCARLYGKGAAANRVARALAEVRMSLVAQPPVGRRPRVVPSGQEGSLPVVVRQAPRLLEQGEARLPGIPEAAAAGLRGNRRSRPCWPALGSLA